MIPNQLTADHEGDFVVLKSDTNKVARIPAEEAVQLARDIIAQADKVLWVSTNADD